MAKQVATNVRDAIHGDHDERAGALGNLGGMAVSKAGGKLVSKGGDFAVKMATKGVSERLASNGTVTAVGTFAGEQLLGNICYAFDGERGRVAGENIGGAAGAAASGALYGAYLGSVGGPIGAAIGGGVGILGWGVSKTAGFCTGLITKVLQGVARVKIDTVEVIGAETWSYAFADNFNCAKRWALERIAEDPENLFANVTHWTGNHMTVHLYRLRRDCVPEFDWAAGDHTLLIDPAFKFQGLCTAKFLSIHGDGGLTDRKYYGGSNEAFIVVPVPEFGEGCFMLRTTSRLPSRKSLLGIGCHRTYECVEEPDADVFQQHRVGSSADGTTASLLSGHEICLRNPSHQNEYVRCCLRRGRGYGVSTISHSDFRYNNEYTTKFTIWKWSGDGAIHSGDEIYLRNPSHGNQYVECFGHAEGGHGVSTGPSQENSSCPPSAKFTIWKWSGDGPIQSGDDIYLRNPSHQNEYVRCCGHESDGYGVSTTASRDYRYHDEYTAKFTVWSWAHRTHGSGGGSVVLYSMRYEKYITNTSGRFHPGDGTSMHVVGLGNETFALMLP